MLVHLLFYISNYFIPVTIVLIICYGVSKGVKPYETFLIGAEEGMRTVVMILPTLIGLMVAVQIFQQSGLLHFLTNAAEPFAKLIAFPVELAPLTLIRLVSSSAATGLLVDIFQTFGTDSYLGRVASVMMSCTETVFYTMSLYFLSVNIQKTRYTLFCALVANFVGVWVAVALVSIVFGK